jgi:hypothetical protein
MSKPERIAFEVGGETVVGTLRRHEGGRALVFLGPLTSVKDQVPGNYAKAMAQRGYTTLAIDNRHFGESGGEPRQYEHPPRKVEDVLAAVAWLREHAGATKVGAIGVCAGAGYMSAAIPAGPIDAFATVAGFFHDAGKQREWMGEGFDEQIERARKARLEYEATGECEMIPAVGLEGEVAMPMKEAYEYYGTDRGAVAGYENAFAVMSREHTLPWDAQRHAAEIRVPTLMVHSENALVPALARKFFAALGGPKQEVWVASKGQIDFYDDPGLIGPVADRLAVYFDAAFGREPARPRIVRGDG